MSGRGVRWGQIELAEPTDPAGDLPPWGPTRLARAVRRGWRWWMLVPALLLAVAVAAVWPVSGTVEHPDQVVDARTLVEVAIATPPPGGGGTDPTGTYLLTTREGTATALQHLLARLGPGRAPGPVEAPLSPQGFPQLDVALLAGAGVAAGRGEPDALGLAARVDDHTPVDQLGLLLHVADVVASLDLSGGRRVLALGAVGPDGRITCSADPATSIAATAPPPDLVLVGTGCAPGASDGDGVPVVEVATFSDALVALT